MKSTISFRRLTDEEFEAERQRALSLWPTGSQIDLDEAVEYHRQIPSHKNYAKTIRDSYESGKTLVQPRGGVPILEWHIKLLRCLQDEGGADLLPTTTDSYTRNEQFANAQRHRREREGGPRYVERSAGGVTVRMLPKVIDSRSPHHPATGSSMTKLTAETVLAAGYSTSRSGIAYTISYTKTMPIEQESATTSMWTGWSPITLSEIKIHRAARFNRHARPSRPARHRRSTACWQRNRDQRTEGQPSPSAFHTT